MVTADDVSALVGGQLSAASGFSTTVPGGVWFGRGPAKDPPAGYPYIVYQIEPGRTELFSGSLYIQTFTVRLAAYVPMGQSVVPSAVEQLMSTALVGQAAQSALQGTSLRNATEKVLHGRPLDATGKYDANLRQGQDVFLAGLSLEVLVQGDRSVT